MRHLRSTLLVPTVLLAGLLATASSARGAMIITDPGDSTIASRITGLTIGSMPGMSFDVDFTQFGQSFNDIWGPETPPSTLPVFYNSLDDSLALRDAIIQELNTAPAITMVGTAGNMTSVVFLPVRVDLVQPLLTDPSVEVGHVPGIYNTSSNTWVPNSPFFDARGSLYDWTVVSKTSTQPVPEPGALSLLGIGAGVLGLVGWRRRRKPLAVID